jgi:hypothetical protein
MNATEVFVCVVVTLPVVPDLESKRDVGSTTPQVVADVKFPDVIECNVAISYISLFYKCV